MFEHIRVPQPSDRGNAILTTALKAAMLAKSPSSAIDALLESLGTSFHAKRAYLYQLPPDGTEFLCTSEWCAPGVEPMADVTYGLTMTMAMRWMGDGEPRSIVAIRDVREIQQTRPTYAALFHERSMHSQVLGKLMRGQSPLGTLGFDDPDPELFDLLCGIMYPICAFATSTVNTKNLLRRMNAMGMVDKLTGAGTRISFYQKVEQLPPNIPVGIAYMDVVGLQDVNDLRGHDAGDELLNAIRQTLVTEYEDDQVFRMSGDEFLLLANNQDEAVFRASMTRIRHRLDDFSVHVAVGTVWRSRLGSDYDSLTRQAWLNCVNEKREWERAGGRRMGDREGIEDLMRRSGGDVQEATSSNLSIPCYLGEEFFRRASVWARHVEIGRIGLAALDINYFKLYNDIYGRAAGDLMLEAYGKKLAAVATACHGVAGYLGGDNFALAFPVGDDLNTQAFARQVESQLTKFAVAEGFAPSVGIAITNDPHAGLSLLYDHALIALQEVRGSYTRHVTYYDEHRHERERENQLLLIEAQEALRRGEFTFYLQPKVNINSNKVVSAEALVRWVHDGKVVPPCKFVGPMERSGYIFALDRHVWESVCAWQRSLLDRGIEPVPISVNVSRVDFYFVDLAEHFASLVRRYDLPPRLVGIEVTESACSKDAEIVNDVIRRMQREGFLVFMDDFGSGYSSLNMLRTVSVDVLKIDKGFIDNADVSAGSDAIISNVIKMAHMMGMPVISEGVETKEQRDSLRLMDCDYVQGYFYYKPMPKDEFEELLRSGDEILQQKTA